jgi:hypothetical protein
MQPISVAQWRDCDIHLRALREQSQAQQSPESDSTELFKPDLVPIQMR